ncbi:type I secretion system permease/ATPase [Neisseriaceae bacterium TC5R-5]|nr:type I secretion system permease/ATPase [Neisseriaceae bacterium TC5R-5]
MTQPQDYQYWMEAMLLVAKHYRLNVAEEHIHVQRSWDGDMPLDARLQSMAQQMGLQLRFEVFHPRLFDPWRLPCIVQFEDDLIGVVEKIDNQNLTSMLFSADQGLATILSLEEVSSRARRVLLLRPEGTIADVRVDDYIKPYQPDWFWRIVLRDWSRYGDIMLASLGANVLALGSTIFSMQIYDRVVPAQSEPTLWVLFIGVILAIGFEMMLRLSRTHISDLIGKRADLKISDQIFGHALRLRNDAKPASTGSFIAQIRELEQVRETITSTTIGSLADLPFFFLFLFIIWTMAGSLVLVPLAALPLLIIPGVLMQAPLARLARSGMREMALRNAILVESVQGMEDIKLLRAEPRFQAQWNHANSVSADVGMQQRFYTSLLMNWTQTVQSAAYVITLLVGCFLVMKGEMSTGTLVGVSILSSRMMAPLAQIAGVLARWQQTKVAREGLDSLIQRPVDQMAPGKSVHRSFIRGTFALKDVKFRYGDMAQPVVLNIAHLDIKAGERVAVLGRNGAGKSTLLQLLSGLRSPQEGQLLLDDLSLAMIDTADVRRDIGLLNQHANLFLGSVRDNLVMGRPQATDTEILQALTLSGALSFVQSLPGNIDYLIQEGGLGLSGGQRQALLLARTLIRQPSVLLLDEPTAWLDEVAEHQLIERLDKWLAHRTLVVATHRPAVLQWVERVIVLHEGQVVMDGAKAQVLQQLMTS